VKNKAGMITALRKKNNSKSAACHAFLTVIEWREWTRIKIKNNSHPFASFDDKKNRKFFPRVIFPLTRRRGFCYAGFNH